MARVAKILVILTVMAGGQMASADNNVKLVMFNWISPAILEPDGTWTFTYVIERTYQAACSYDLNICLTTCPWTVATFT